MLIGLNLTDLLIYLDEDLTKNLNSLVISGYIEKRTSRWIEDRAIAANMYYEDRMQQYEEDRCGKDERDGYKGKNCSSADTTTNWNEQRQGLDGKRLLRREEELTRIYTTFELHQQLISGLSSSSLLKSVSGDWSQNEDIRAGDYIEISGTISSESVTSYLDVFTDMVNGIGIENVKKYCKCRTDTLDNFDMVMNQVTHLQNLLATNNTQDLIITTECNDIVVIVNNSNFLASYANIFDKMECPCKVIGKVIKVCDSEQYIHLLRKSGQPNYYENILGCCKSITTKLATSGLYLPTEPKLKVQGKTILIIPISVSI